jgi:NTE family protein
MAERTILVLGGGGVKGLTHVGAWRALRECGVEVHEILGTSIGSLVGAAIAGGSSTEELGARARALAKADIVGLNRWALLLNGIRQPAIFRGEPLRDYIASVLPVTRWDELGIPFATNAVRLETGQMDWFGAGGRTDVPLADAVQASCALPVFYPPVELEGEYYVDGGVVDALPLTRARERGATRVIAVDAGSGPVKDDRDTVDAGLIAIHHRVTDIMNYARKQLQVAAWTGPELILVRPRLRGISTFDFERTAFFLEEGYRSMRAALAEQGLAAPLTEGAAD